MIAMIITVEYPRAAGYSIARVTYRDDPSSSLLPNGCPSVLIFVFGRSKKACLDYCTTNYPWLLNM